MKAISPKVALRVILAALAVLYCVLADQAVADSPQFCKVDTAQAAFEAQTGQESHFTSRNPRGVVLLVSQSEASPGAWIYARLANFGGATVGYGREFMIEHLTASGWQIDPASPKGPWVKVLGRLNPGSAGRCYAFQFPADPPAGRYRFSTRIRLPLNGRKWIRRIAPFAVEVPRAMGVVE
jgi:hypothetical protein